MIKPSLEVIKDMPSHMVNLDALIRREDFTVNVDLQKTNALNQDTKMKIVELETSSLWLSGCVSQIFREQRLSGPPKR